MYGALKTSGSNITRAAASRVLVMRSQHEIRSTVT
jgi:hypothetical protein